MEESNIMFKDLGLSDAMLKALEKKGYGYPTTIQQEAIPCFMQWKDVVAKAPTGTGKTFAFGIPMIEHVDPEVKEVQGLILAPTRELAIQIGDELRGLLTYYSGIRVAVLYGGAGRCLGNHIFPLHEAGNRLLLDSGGIAVSLLLQRFQHGIAQTQILKHNIAFFHWNSSFFYVLFCYCSSFSANKQYPFLLQPLFIEINRKLIFPPPLTVATRHKICYILC